MQEGFPDRSRVASQSFCRCCREGPDLLNGRVVRPQLDAWGLHGWQVGVIMMPPTDLPPDFLVSCRGRWCPIPYVQAFGWDIPALNVFHSGLLSLVIVLVCPGLLVVLRLVEEEEGYRRFQPQTSERHP